MVGRSTRHIETLLPSGQPLAPSASAKAAASVLLSAATSLGTLEAIGVSAASAPVGGGLLHPIAASGAVAAIALSAPSLLSVAADSTGAATGEITVAPFGQPITPVASTVGAATVPITAAVLLDPGADTVSAAALPVGARTALILLSARSVSGTLLSVSVLGPRRPYTFDSIAIFNTDGFQVAEIARSLGPLETGYLDDLGNWIPAADPVALITDGFGLTAAGVAYFDTRGVDPGDEADLFLDPVDNLLWLSR